MIHARDDYNRIQDPAGMIPADEPVFLLRAQDALACKAVAYYAELCKATQAPEVAAKAEAHSQRMAEWPKKKVPDLSEAPVERSGSEALRAALDAFPSWWSREGGQTQHRFFRTGIRSLAEAVWTAAACAALKSLTTRGLSESLHDDLCATRRGHPCNCASAALSPQGSGSGSRGFVCPEAGCAITDPRQCAHCRHRVA